MTSSGDVATEIAPEVAAFTGATLDAVRAARRAEYANRA
jgi:hypothetical protein